VKNSLARTGVSIFRLFCLIVLVSCPLLAQTFSSAGNMTTERYAMSVTQLQNGMILIAGGQGPGSGTLASAELYNPATGTFTATGSLTHARYLHTATLLNNGKVLIVGGFSSGDVRDDSELYDPATGLFTPTGSLITARVWHTANVITTGANAGNVIVIGGQSGSGGTLASAEIYNVAAGTFSEPGINLTHARYGHTATVLNNGEILVVGGFSSGNTRSVSELFNPQLLTFSDSGSTLVPTAFHTATLLLNGNVLISGGNQGTGSNYITMGQIYNPTTGAFTATGNFVSPRQSPATAMLNDGTVLMAGGYKSGYLATAEVYNPSTNAWTATGSMANAREQEYLVAAPVLGNVDNVLVAGGRNTTGDLQSAELYKGPPTYAGFVNPKYMVLNVQYSPPGASSTVDYGTTTNVGTSSSLMNMFSTSDMTTLTVSLTLGKMAGSGGGGGDDGGGGDGATPAPGVNPVTGAFSDSLSNTWTEEQDSSLSVSFDKSSGSDVVVKGPATNAVGLDHTNDKIVIWLNPVAAYQITGTRVNLSGYYFDTTDNVVNDFDTVTLSVAQCLNPSLITNNTQLNQLMRAWAQDEVDGSAPGITAQDLLNIVKADPFSTAGYSIGTGTCSTDGRYCLDSNINSDIQYASPQEGGQGNTLVYSEGYMSTVTQGQGAKDTHTSSFTVDDSLTFFGIFKTDLKTTDSYTTTNQWSTTTSQAESNTIKTTIVPPSYADNYQGPTEFQVYQDNVYGTLMFQPVTFDGFILGAAPASQSILAGAQTSYTVSTPIAGTFSGSLNLSVSGLPTGATAQFSANPINAGANSTMTVTTSTSTKPGTYILTIAAVYSTDLPHTDQVTLVVGADPDFSVTAAPSSQSVTVGSSNTYTISTTALNGFTGSVTLSSSNVPAGVTITFGTNPVVGTGTSTATVQAGSSAAPGGYTVTFTGTSGTLTHSVSVTLMVVAATKDFSLSITPSGQGVVQGGTANYTITTTAINGFTGSVTLTIGTLPAGASATFTPNPMTVPSTSTLAIKTSTTTPTGTTNLTVTGTSGTLSHQATPPATLTVDAP
jgi:hypothetical protein